MQTYLFFYILSNNYVKIIRLFILHFCKMILHKGEILERAIRKHRFPITLLAKRLGKSRQHIYNLFEYPDVPLELMIKIGKIIQHDFSSELKELAQIPIEYKLEAISKPDISFETVNYWKSKYFELLDLHKKLLQTNKLLLENKLRKYLDEVSPNSKNKVEK